MTDYPVIWPMGRKMSGFGERLWGLIKVPEPAAYQAFWFPRCRSIHTFGMKAPIDVLGLDQEQRIRQVERHVCPGQVRYFKGCDSVLELASFSPWPLQHWLGQQLIFNRQGVPEHAQFEATDPNYFAIAVAIAGARLPVDRGRDAGAATGL